MASKLWIKKAVSCACGVISITNRAAVNPQECPPNIKFVLFSS